MMRRRLTWLLAPEIDSELSCFILPSTWLSRCKAIYYTIFSWLYSLMGHCSHLAMVNSSWTNSHIENLWKIPERTWRVYPPCDTSALQLTCISLHILGIWFLIILTDYLCTCNLELPLKGRAEVPIIISVAQFRPEKAHTLQLEAFLLSIQRLDPDLPKPKLQYVGSCRHEEDLYREVTKVER